MTFIPAGTVKPMSDDDKWKEAKRILPLIKHELPKNTDFAIYIERNNLKLSNEDAFILNEVQDEVSKLLVRSGLYEYNPPDNTVWLKRVYVDEDSELKHEILKFLYKLHLQFYRKDLADALRIDVYKLDYLTENMKNDGSINQIDASSKKGKDYIIGISDKGNGMYLNDYYLQRTHVSNQFIIKYEKTPMDLYYEFHKGRQEAELQNEIDNGQRLEDLENNREVTAPKMIDTKIIANRRMKLASKFINWVIKHTALFIFYVAVAVVAAYLVLKFKFYPH